MSATDARAWCLTCSLSAGAPVVAGISSPGHYYLCGRRHAQTDGVCPSAPQPCACCTCCEDTSHAAVRGVAQ